MLVLVCTSFAELCGTERERKCEMKIHLMDIFGDVHLMLRGIYFTDYLFSALAWSENSFFGMPKTEYLFPTAKTGWGFGLSKVG